MTQLIAIWNIVDEFSWPTLNKGTLQTQMWYKNCITLKQLDGTLVVSMRLIAVPLISKVVTLSTQLYIYQH